MINRESPAPLLFIIAVLCVTFQANYAVCEAKATQQLSTYASGKLIVKYSDRVGICVHHLIRQRSSFADATTSGSSTLDLLHARYHVLDAQPVFRRASDETDPSVAGIRSYQRRQFDAIREKFPGRTARIPQGEVIPDLHHIYVLTLPPETDIMQAVADFSRDPDVLYAQPDYVVETQYVPDDPYYHSSHSWEQSYDDLWALKRNKLNLHVRQVTGC